MNYYSIYFYCFINQYSRNKISDFILLNNFVKLVYNLSKYKISLN